MYFSKKNGSALFLYYLKYKLGLIGKFNKQQLAESYHYNTFGKLTIKNQNIPPIQLQQPLHLHRQKI
ncbi:hypothetical protein BTHERMOSOX_261 [Bathymodiolus thermophilus thioautotrophic gill symbiont]|nr:hypothetical protein BTHERMOSOX_261 [Bathymodiolus thermophilus thioautotrophic gill symbiont]